MLQENSKSRRAILESISVYWWWNHRGVQYEAVFFLASFLNLLNKEVKCSLLALCQRTVKECGHRRDHKDGGFRSSVFSKHCQNYSILSLHSFSSHIFFLTVVLCMEPRALYMLVHTRLLRYVPKLLPLILQYLMYTLSSITHSHGVCPGSSIRYHFSISWVLQCVPCA